MCSDFKKSIGSTMAESKDTRIRNCCGLAIYNMFSQSLDNLQSFIKRAEPKVENSRQSNVIPIVFNLPYDITQVIWSQLSLLERLQCTQVCQRWRTQLLESPCMWSTVSGDFGRVLKGYKIDGRLIHRVDLTYGPQGIDFLLRHECNNIQSITGAHIPNEPALMKLQELLRFTGSAVKSLRINTQASLDGVLSMISTQCSSLTRLRLFVDTRPRRSVLPNTDTIAANIAALEPMKHVVDLSLMMVNRMPYRVIDVLQLFPGLRDICIVASQYPDRQWLPYIDNTYPAWRSIQLGPTATEEKSHFEYREVGCRALAYGFGWVDDTSLQAILRQHGSMMTAFHMTDTFGPQKSNIIQKYLIDIDAPSKLRSLAVTGQNGLAYGFTLERITNRLPLLEQLVLKNLDFSWATRQTSIPQLPLPQLNRSLKRLKLASCYGIPRQDFDRLVSRLHPSMELISFIELKQLPDLDSIVINVSSVDKFFLSQEDLTNDEVLSLANKWVRKRINSLTIKRVGMRKIDRELTKCVQQRLPTIDVVEIF